MLNIPDSVKALFKRDGVYKNFRAHFPNGELADITNENIVQESVKFTESVCSQDVFKFGLTEASVIEFETVGVGNMYGMTIECSCEIDCSSLSAADKADIAAGTWDGTWDGENEVFAVPYGTFRVESCPRDHQAMTHRRVTAYTAEAADFSLKEFPQTDYISQWFKAFFVDIAAIEAFELGNDLVLLDEGDTFEPSSTIIPWNRHPLYDNLGRSYNIYERFVVDNRVTQAETSFVVFLSRTSTRPEWSIPKSFVVWDTTDAQAKNYFDHGTEIARLIDGAGYDFRFDSQGTQIFKTNLDAILATYPELFGPCVTYSLDKRNINIQTDPLRMGGKELVPIFSPEVSGYNSAFIPQNPFSVRDVDIYAVASYDTFSRHYISITRAGVEIAQIDITHTLPTEQHFKCYGLQAYSQKIKVESSSSSKTQFQGYNGSSFGNLRLDSFSYADTFDVREMFNGILELKAKFGTYSRKTGATEAIRIDNTSPVPVIPGEYRQMWFDEYNVEPIGTIRYSYTDEAGEEQVVDYRFGDGASVYDMTDNEVLKLMDGADPSTIEAMLDAYFVPHIAAVNFVPVDLSMKGLPYLEAGDAISVTAQDGTVCNSYALRQEISGIQALEAQIDSQSGLIIESEAATT